MFDKVDCIVQYFVSFTPILPFTSDKDVDKDIYIYISFSSFNYLK